MSRAGMWFKMAAAFTVFSIGGPALISYVQPTDEELFKKYNPELQKRSLENRKGKQEDFDRFVTKLKEYSRSDKPIWEVAAEDEAQAKTNAAEEQQRLAAEMQKRREEIKRLSVSGK
ncbi:MAG: hypothetical protein LQ338_002819 [Usnochroma carphineum]|nr:MAG: hypothetical protein LQ338_002819 [Usnochroma carphineum]